MNNLPLVPPQASDWAGPIDALFWTLNLLTIAFTALVAILVIALAIRYRRGNPVDRSNPVHTSHVLELSWSIGPMFLGLAMFVWAAKLYAGMYGNPPADAQDVYVIGKQWMWHLQHTNGIRENNEMHIPVGKPIKMVMISQDVIHSFFVPAFRIKRDVIPGRFTSFWFTPTRAGKYHLLCAEYCGTDHSEMTGYVYVMEPAEYQTWLETKGARTQDTQPAPTTMVEAGKALYEQYGCGDCHDPEGMNRGPILAGVFNTRVRTRDGGSVLADESYLRKSILEPSEEIADQYQQVMPSYKGQLSEEQVVSVIEYIKSMGRQGAAGTAGMKAVVKPGTGTGTPASGDDFSIRSRPARIQPGTQSMPLPNAGPSGGFSTTPDGPAGRPTVPPGPGTGNSTTNPSSGQGAAAPGGV
jgi:cytochrome c oxidase subunit 2